MDTYKKQYKMLIQQVQAVYTEGIPRAVLDELEGFFRRLKEEHPHIDFSLRTEESTREPEDTPVRPPTPAREPEDTPVRPPTPAREPEDTPVRPPTPAREPEDTPVRPPTAKTPKRPPWKRQAALLPCKSTHEHHIYVIYTTILIQHHSEQIHQFWMEHLVTPVPTLPPGTLHNSEATNLAGGFICPKLG